MPRPLQRTDTHKTCPMCKEEKLLIEYYRSDKYDGGYSPYCKACTALKNKQGRNKERDNAYANKRNRANPEPNRIRAREYSRRLREEKPAFYRAKKFFDVKRKGIAHDVDRVYLESLFLNTKNCQCCGRRLELEYKPRETRAYKSNMNSPSVDRIHNHKGYSRDNIAIICWECNYRKTDLSREDLLMLLNYIERCGNV